MKRLLIILIIFSCTSVYAQNEQTGSEKTVRSIVNTDKNQRIILKTDDEEFYLKVKFLKSETSKIKTIFQSSFDTDTRSSSNHWTLNKKDYSIKLSKGKVLVKMDKKNIGKDDFKAIQEGINEMFGVLGWSVEEAGLWNFKGNWNIKI